MLTLPAVVGAALVDAINPCAFAVLIILLTTVLARGEKRAALASGLAFTLSIYLAYFFMGLGLFSAIQSSGIAHSFFFFVAVLAVLIGLFNVKDYFWYGKVFLMEVPRRWRPTLKRLIQGVTSVPGAFAIGLLVSLFLLPCTSGPYIVILGLLAKSATRLEGVAWLLLYNAIFVLPMIVITLALFFGLVNVERLEERRQRALRLLHLIAGGVMLILGAAMLFSLATGGL